MGVQVVAKGVDAEQYATEYAAPVRRGLEGVFFLNGSLEKCARNYAPGKLAGSIVGAPVLGANFLTCKGANNYIQTQIDESEFMTMVVIGRAPTVVGVPASADTPIYVASYNTGQPSGVVMYPSTSDRVSGGGCYGADSTSSANVIASVAPIAASAFGLYSTVVKPGGPTTKAHTANLTTTTANVNPRILSNRKLRIGSGYNNAQTGLCDIAVVQIHSVALSDDELARTVADLRAYALRRGIIV